MRGLRGLLQGPQGQGDGSAKWTRLLGCGELTIEGAAANSGPYIDAPRPPARSFYYSTGQGEQGAGQLDHSNDTSPSTSSSRYARAGQPAHRHLRSSRHRPRHLLPTSSLPCHPRQSHPGRLSTRGLHCLPSLCSRRAGHDMMRHGDIGLERQHNAVPLQVYKVHRDDYLLASCCCAPSETQHPRAYRTSALRPLSTYMYMTRPPIVVSSSRVPAKDIFINRSSMKTANHSSPTYARGLCFNRPASRATPRFARNRCSSFACTTRRPSTGDCTGWWGAVIHSVSVLRRASYGFCTRTASVVSR
jgi:hypothetical protein